MGEGSIGGFYNTQQQFALTTEVIINISASLLSLHFCESNEIRAAEGTGRTGLPRWCGRFGNMTVHIETIENECTETYIITTTRTADIHTRTADTTTIIIFTLRAIPARLLLPCA